MPRGRVRGGHKGQRRHFSNPDQLEEKKEKEEREKRWRQQRGEIESDESGEEKSSDSSSSEPEEDGVKGAAEGSDAEDKEEKAKGVQHLIEVENPNRIIKKEKKVPTLEETDTGPQLSRREREEVEKQKAKAHYMKMHAAGKTAEARADLARLAIIKQQREEAAKKRELEIRAKKEAEAAKTELTKKALGKKT